MSDELVSVVFNPGNNKIEARMGVPCFEAAAAAGVSLCMPCGGSGRCGKCKVFFEKGAPLPTDRESSLLTAQELDQGWRLACCTKLFQDAVISAPLQSQWGGYHQIQVEGVAVPRKNALFQEIKKILVQMPPPTLADDRSDLVRVENAVRQKGAFPEETTPFQISLPLLRRLGNVLRSSSFQGTATVRNHRLIDFEAEDTADACYAAAFDIGTTTLAAVLLHIPSGNQMAATSAMNPQAKYGDDVLSRISRACDSEEMLLEMQNCLLEQVQDMIDHLCRQAEISSGHIYAAVFTGNTTMEHLLCGVSPVSLGVSPFVSVWSRGLVLRPDEMRLKIHPEAQIWIFPVIGGFVGGDTVAGLAATDLLHCEGPVLMVDIGTNGEIALASEGRLWAASTAAGPAFEGARISQGMQAAVGAIERVVIDDDIKYDVIGNVPPKGICGSGLIDAVGQLLKAGVVHHDGRIKSGQELECVSESLRRKVRTDEAGLPYVVVADTGKECIRITQQDIRELQLGAAAIRAGIRIVLKQADIIPDNLKEVLIAGGFGTFIRRDNAQRIGLIPHELSHDKISFVGNIALLGAKIASIDPSIRDEAEFVSRHCHHVELSLDSDFALEFAMAMQFPNEFGAD